MDEPKENFSRIPNEILDEIIKKFDSKINEINEHLQNMKHIGVMEFNTKDGAIVLWFKNIIEFDNFVVYSNQRVVSEKIFIENQIKEGKIN